MPRNYPRSERVEQLAKEVLGEAIRELKDPRVGFVTVTDVKLTHDLRTASLYVSAFGTDEEREATMGALQHAKSHLRSIIGREIRLRTVPELEILEDKTAQNGQRIEQLLREIGVSKPPVVDSGDEDGGEPDEA